MRSATVLLLCLLAVAGCTKPAPSASPGSASPASAGFSLESPSLTEGKSIDKAFTCDGADRSPALRWSTPPAGTRSLALIVDDPDAPSGVFTHWLLYGLAPSRRELPENVERTAEVKQLGRQAKNDFDKIGWNGPCPPSGAPHRYRFKLLALSVPIELGAEAGKKELEAAIAGKLIAQATLTASYRRAK